MALTVYLLRNEKLNGLTVTIFLIALLQDIKILFWGGYEH
jgi:hypothetical protein